MRSRIANKDKTIKCENPDCGRKDRPLYIWHPPTEDKITGSLLICDICTVRTSDVVPM